MPVENGWMKLELVCRLRGLLRTHRRNPSDSCSEFSVYSSSTAQTKRTSARIKSSALISTLPRISCRLPPCGAVVHSRFRMVSQGTPSGTGDLRRLAALFGEIPRQWPDLCFCGGNLIVQSGPFQSRAGSRLETWMSLGFEPGTCCPGVRGVRWRGDDNTPGSAHG
ncbi:hypothetical protein GWK47_040744 [Chionoecetes opilio]|uniref:Uncharacterized protein n=1 Tax=Chionoecetes opilio TaxID=41210 RepID=A0A8J4YBT4_CHIOP|nr:hypothetical protein GWK47_040744 [Chionoecetes opilio]